MKKVLALILSCALLLSVFAGCSSTATEENTSSTAADSSESSEVSSASEEASDEPISLRFISATTRRERTL